MITGQRGVITGQRGVITSQRGVITVITGQSGVITGQRGDRLRDLRGRIMREGRALLQHELAGLRGHVVGQRGERGELAGRSRWRVARVRAQLLTDAALFGGLCHALVCAQLVDEHDVEG